MTTIAPGLIGDSVAAASFRVFLGAPPQLAIEKRLLRHMHRSVGSWFVTRKRVREQANEYLEFDGATVDTEILQRHCHIFFLRRQFFNDMLDKQLAILEAGKPPREPDNDLLVCLGEMNESLLPRVLYERKRLEHAKARCVVPHRRELVPDSQLDKWDTLCMMRWLEHDMVVTGDEPRPDADFASAPPSSVVDAGFDAEGHARAFLPLSAVQDSADRLAQLFVKVGSGVSADAANLPTALPKLDKKDEKLGIKAFVPGDYQKVGLSVPRLRPSDATALFRFSGERLLTQHSAAADLKRDAGAYFFRRAVWGNIFRRYATDPAFLTHSVSQYWAAGEGGMHTAPPSAKMPLPLAEIVCRQQREIAPATKLRTQFMYAHHDHAKQLWRSELVFPSLRMLSAIGTQTAEDMLASVLVDGFFAEQGLSSSSSSSSSSSVVADDKVRQVVAFANEVSAMRTSSLDALLQRAKTALNTHVAPPLSDEEANWHPQRVGGGDAEEASSTVTIEGDDDNDGEDIELVEEGEPELDPIPGENLGEK